ncbi:MAG: alkylresorcinol/alkylpyrone synthase [Myxococcota bacterium]|jgi:alkylresorcinol/alkylpyrone synthase
MSFHLDTLTTMAGAHTRSQDELAATFRGKLAAVPDSKKISQLVGFIYARSGISARHLEADPVEIEARDDWYALVNEATFSLACRTLESLFSSGEEPGALDGLIIVSASYAGFPGLSRRLQDRYDFPLEARCYDLAAMGCGGSTQGLELAQTLVTQGTCRRVLVLCVDVMGTHGEARKHRIVPDVSQVVAHCLASDGAAAVVVADKPGPRTVLSYETGRLFTQLWPDSLDLNDFTADADNQPFIAVGKDIRTRLLGQLQDLLSSLHGPLVMHPGGTALMQILAEHFPTRKDEIHLALSILQDNGNIGAASALWVLERALQRGLDLNGTCQLFALGPGIVSTLFTMDGVTTHVDH